MYTTVTKVCCLCNKSTTLTLPEDKVKRWQNGELVQNVFPEMTPDEREILISGTHPECWDKIFKEEEY